MSTIQALAFKRSQLSRAKKELKEINNPGVYLLLGLDQDDNDRKVAYIGESEDVAKRLQFHSGNEKGKDKKEFWTDTIALVCKNDNLTKSHARHIEAKLIATASENTSWKLTNDKKPLEAGKLSRPDEAAMEEFIEQAKMLTRALGWDLFKPTSGNLVPSHPNLDSISESVDSPEFYFTGAGFAAIAVVSGTSGDWIIKATSQAKLEPSSKIPNSTKKLRDQLIAAGKLVELDGRLVFKEDCLFPTASAAANVVCGRAANGRVEWKLADGMDYATWEAKQSEEVADSAIKSEQILLSQEVGSVPRILDTINCFRRKYGSWPTRLLVDEVMAKAIQQDNLTLAGWQALANKLDVKYSVVGTVIAEDDAGNTFEHDSACISPEDKQHSADYWIWGCEVWPKP
jgi:predicted GIY-YIG superfamily endonuclease